MHARSLSELAPPIAAWRFAVGRMDHAGARHQECTGSPVLQRLLIMDHDLRLLLLRFISFPFYFYSKVAFRFN
jgi:hypothetical protein